MRACGLINTKSPILTQPTSRLGFDFPSIEAVNAELAISAVLRALNHHLPPMRQMANITMANLQCQYNKCVPPFADPRTDLTRPSPIRTTQSFCRSAPATWLTAHNALTSARLQVVQTDQSHLKTSKFVHIRQMAQVHGHAPPSDQLVRATAVPAHETARIDDWIAVVQDGAVDDQRWGDDARAFARDLSFAELAPHDPWSTLSRQEKLRKYEDTIHVAFIRHQLARRPPDDDRRAPDRWATDGSYDRDRNAAAAAVTGPEEAQLRLSPQQEASATSAEHLGLAAAMIRIHRLGPVSPQSVLTDHLASVRKAASVLPDTRTQVFDPTRHTNSSAWFETALHSCRRRHLQVSVSHVKAHTNADDPASRLNDRADQLAKAAIHSPVATTMPPLTVHVPRYMVWHRGRGLLRRSKKLVVDSAIEERFLRADQRLRDRLRDDRLDQHELVPKFPYLKSKAVVATRTQLITRTGQLNTAMRKHYLSGGRESSRCTLCGAAVQDSEHIFHQCPFFADTKRRWVDNFVHRAQRKYGQDTGPLLREYVEAVVNNQQFWMGFVAEPLPPLPAALARDTHCMIINLTAHIVGIMGKEARQ